TLLASHRERLERPLGDVRQRISDSIKHQVDMAADQILYRWAEPLIRRVHHADTRAPQKNFGRELGGTRETGRSVGELARIGLGVGDELRKSRNRKLRVDHDDQLKFDQRRHRGQLGWVEAQLGKHVLVYSEGSRRSDKQRVSVRRGFRY